MRFRHPNLILSHVIQTHPEMHIRPSGQGPTNPGTSTVFFTFHGEHVTSVPEAFENDQTVADWKLVTSFTEQRIYHVRPQDTVLSLATASSDVNTPILNAASSSKGWELRLLFPSRDAFSRFREFCTTNDITFQLLRLSPPESIESASTSDVTVKQKEALTTAYQEGYFDLPRRITQEKLAEKLELSDTAVSQRLRRGIANLIENELLQ